MKLRKELSAGLAALVASSLLAGCEPTPTRVSPTEAPTRPPAATPTKPVEVPTATIALSPTPESWKGIKVDQQNLNRFSVGGGPESPWTARRQLVFGEEAVTNWQKAVDGLVKRGDVPAGSTINLVDQVIFKNSEPTNFTPTSFPKNLNGRQLVPGLSSIVDGKGVYADSAGKRWVADFNASFPLLVFGAGIVDMPNGKYKIMPADQNGLPIGGEIIDRSMREYVAPTPTAEPTKPAVEKQVTWNQKITVAKDGKYSIKNGDFAFMTDGSALKFDLSKAGVGARVGIGVESVAVIDSFVIEKKTDGIYVNGNKVLSPSQVVRLDSGDKNDNYMSYVNGNPSKVNNRVVEVLRFTGAAGTTVDIANPQNKLFAEVLPPTAVPTQRPPEKCIEGIVRNPNSPEVPIVGGGFILSGVGVVKVGEDTQYAYVQTYDPDTQRVFPSVLRVDKAYFQARDLLGTPDCAK